MSLCYLFLYVAMNNLPFIEAGINLRTGQTRKETEKQKQIDINYWLKWNVLKKKKTRKRKQSHSGL